VISSIAGLLRAAHFLPTVTVTTLTFLLAWRTSDPVTSAGIAATVFMGQLIVGWTNDILDYYDDLLHERENKPLVAGSISINELKFACILVAITLLTLTFLGPLTGRFGFAHLLAVISAITYNFKLKSTPFSFLPYAFSFGLLPAIVLGATSQPSKLWMALVGASFGLGVHLANVFKDLESDRESGIYGLPQLLGVRKSRIGCALSFGVGGLILALNTSENSAWFIVFTAISFLLPLPRKFVFPFAMLLGLAVMAVFISAIS
jgi:4-hydroxybenzoate polyprenyltransferase